MLLKHWFSNGLHPVAKIIPWRWNSDKCSQIVVGSLASSCLSNFQRHVAWSHHYKSNFLSFIVWWLLCGKVNLTHNLIPMSLCPVKRLLYGKIFGGSSISTQKVVCVSPFRREGLLHWVLPAQFITDKVLCTWCCVSSPLPRIYCMD